MVKPCLVCGRLTTGSRCELHRKRPNDPRRGSGAARRRFRQAALRKTGGRCARCGSRDRVEAHHRVSLVDGGTNSAANAEALCFKCHRSALRTDVK